MHPTRMIYILPTLLAGAGLWWALGLDQAARAVSAQPLALTGQVSRSVSLAPYSVAAVAPTLIGHVWPIRSAELAADARRVVSELLVEPGSVVSAGAPIVRFEQRVERLNLELSELVAGSEVERRRAAIELHRATTELERIERLGSTAAPKELLDAQSAVRRAQVELEQAQQNAIQAELESERAQALLDRLTIVAPFDGVVDEVLVEVGEGVDAGTPIVRLVDLTGARIEVDCPVEHLTSVRAAAAFAIEPVGFEGTRQIAQLRDVRRVMDAAGQMVRMTLELRDLDPPLPAGLRVRVHPLGELAASGPAFGPPPPAAGVPNHAE